MKQQISKLKKLTAVLLMLSLFIGTGIGPAKAKTVSAAQTKYWIKVNKQANVATVYKLTKGKYKPIKAFLVSCGGSNTPSGTFYTPAKYRWQTLMGPSYGQYCTRIHGGILFHSVWYYSHSKASQSTVQFNKLGKTASHGCVRLSVADAKWIYDNCKLGTKVTIYSSKNPGPLGKPKPIKVSTSRSMYWDPTDPDKNNPYRKVKPTIKISSKKKKTVEYGKSYSVKSHVTAKDNVTKKSLTKKVKYSVTKYNAEKKKYYKAKFSTKSLGTYKIKYSVKSALGKSASKTIKVEVVDTLAPVISNAANKTVTINTKNAVFKTTAKMRSGKSRTSAMTVSITKPGEKKATSMSYSKAKSYVFNKAGTYTVKYTVKNSNKPYRAASKTVKVTVKGYKNAEIKANPTAFTMTVTDPNAVDQAKKELEAQIIKAISITDNGTKVIPSDKNLKFEYIGQNDDTAYTDFSKDGNCRVKVTYTGTKNKKPVSVIVNISVKTEIPLDGKNTKAIPASETTTAVE